MKKNTNGIHTTVYDKSRLAALGKGYAARIKRQINSADIIITQLYLSFVRILGLSWKQELVLKGRIRLPFGNDACPAVTCIAMSK